MQNTDFYKFGVGHCGLNGNALNQYMSSVSKRAMRIADAYTSPTIIEERPMNVASMDVFSRLMMDRIIFLGDEIDDYVANVITAQMLYLSNCDRTGKDISLYINSPGGIVSAGLSIVDVMDYVNCDITTVVTGMAASMASIILAKGTKGKRYALPHSKVMIHQPLGGVQGQATEMEIAMEEMRKCKKSLFDLLSQTTGQPYEKIEADCDRDHYLTAQEALEYGLIDKIYTKQKR